MDIACLSGDVAAGVTTHQEINPTNILSVIANLTPFSDFNQSPRNMYQCQMGKQSMGTPMHAFPYRTDNKLYRLMTVQTPIVRPLIHEKYGVDNYPHGVNAVVAVISYTGYDMEDAMILNKSAFERGFGRGIIHKSEFIDLAEHRQRGEPILHHFQCPDVRLSEGKLDADGFPFIGSTLTQGDPFYSYVNDTTGACKIVRFKGIEDAVIEDVALCGKLIHLAYTCVSQAPILATKRFKKFASSTVWREIPSLATSFHHDMDRRACVRNATPTLTCHSRKAA